jgi:N-acetylglutamate synthase-like GNAT family acetyltransferase
MGIHVSRADTRHRASINRLIREARIGSGIRGPVRDFWFVRRGNRMVACGGIEMHKNTVAVLTSRAVEKPFRGRGFGGALIRHRAKVGRDRGAKTLALCTPFWNINIFRRFGFETCKRAELPNDVRTFWQFTARQYKWCAVMILAA